MPQGGVDGRQIKLVTADDGSSPTGFGASAQSLIAQGVFGIIGVSPFVFGGAKTMQQAGVPVTGGAFDGPEWGMQPYTNMFSYTDPQDPKDPQYTTIPTFMKQNGVDHGGVGGLRRVARRRRPRRQGSSSPRSTWA